MLAPQLSSGPWGWWPCRTHGGDADKQWVVWGKAGKDQPWQSSTTRDADTSSGLRERLPGAGSRGRTLQTSPRPLAFHSHLPGDSYFCRISTRSSRIFLMWIWVFLFVVLSSEFSFPITLKGKHCLEEPAHPSFPCRLPPLG